ncbi:hypothetical protein V6Z12_A01G149200 [Gossypium hirsutum]
MEAISEEIYFVALEQNSTILGKGHSTMRPPLFNATNSSYWRTRMKLFIQANDYEVWKIITNGSSIPIKRVEGVIFPNEENSSNYDDDEKMVMFARRFKRFMRSNKGRQFQKKNGLKIESTKEKYPIISYECKKLGHIKFDCAQWRKKGV